MMSKRKVRIIMNLISMLVGAPAIFLLFTSNWKIGLGVFLLMFSNNLMLYAKMDKELNE